MIEERLVYQEWKNSGTTWTRNEQFDKDGYYVVKNFFHEKIKVIYKNIYKFKGTSRLKDLDIGVIICPSAAISMTQHNEFNAPIHNSIGPVKVLTDEGVSVGLGIDNIEDIFMPFCDGDFEFELRLLAESERIYKPNLLMNIANNDMGFNSF